MASAKPSYSIAKTAPSKGGVSSGAEAIGARSQPAPSGSRQPGNSDGAPMQPGHLSPSGSRTPSGVEGLDQLLGGGIPSNSNILLFGEPLCGKKPLLMQFLYEGMKQGIPGIFVLADFGYSDWKSKMSGSGWDVSPFEQNGLANFIDCYTKQFEPSVIPAPNVHFVESPSDLSGISLHLSRVQEQIMQKSPTHRIAFHSLSSILEETSESSFYRFLQFLVGKFRKEGACALYAMEKGMHDDKDVAMVEHLMDGVIEFEAGKIRARGIPWADGQWREYQITQGGLEIKI